MVPLLKSEGGPAKLSPIASGACNQRSRQVAIITSRYQSQGWRETPL